MSKQMRGSMSQRNSPASDAFEHAHYTQAISRYVPVKQVSVNLP
jgi:hypothetical protein